MKKSFGEYDLVLDTDGVILDFLRHFEKHSSEVLGRPVTRVSRLHDLTDRYGLSKQEVDICWRSFEQSGRWKDIDPLPDAIEAVRALEKSGARIHIVTGIAPDYHMDRILNFKLHGFHPSSMTCVGSSFESKRKAISDIAPIAFADDRLEHIHDNQQVPILVWIDHGDIQPHADREERHDVRVSSLAEWVDDFLSHPIESYLQKIKQSSPLVFKGRPNSHILK